MDRKALIVYLSVLIDPLLLTSYNPLVPVLKTAFNVNIELVSASLTFHMVPFAVLTLISGTLSDLYERPKIFMYGLFISCLGSLLGALSPDILLFIFSRILQGIGSALIIPVSLAIIADITPREKMGKAMGQYGIFISLGATVGPLIAGYLSFIEWRLVPLTFFAYSLCIGIITKVIFSIQGMRIIRSGEGSFNSQQFKRVASNRNLIFASLGGFILFFSFQGIQALISDSLSLPPLLLRKEEIGILFSLVGVVGIPFSIIGGSISDRIGDKKTMTLAYLAMIIPTFLLTLTNSYLPYLGSLLLMSGFNKIGWNSDQTLAVTLTPEARGTASSILNFIRCIGFGVAPIIMASIYKTRGIDTLYIADIFLFLLGFLLSILIHTEVSKK